MLLVHWNQFSPSSHIPQAPFKLYVVPWLSSRQHTPAALHSAARGHRSQAMAVPPHCPLAKTQCTADPASTSQKMTWNERSTWMLVKIKVTPTDLLNFRKDVQEGKLQVILLLVSWLWQPVFTLINIGRGYCSTSLRDTLDSYPNSLNPLILPTMFPISPYSTNPRY